jgi:hypothetical protein
MTRPQSAPPRLQQASLKPSSLTATRKSNTTDTTAEDSPSLEPLRLTNVYTPGGHSRPVTLQPAAKDTPDSMRLAHAQQAGAAAAAEYRTPDSLDFWQSRARTTTYNSSAAYTHIITGYTDSSIDSQTKLNSPPPPQRPFDCVLNVEENNSALLKTALEKEHAQLDKGDSSLQKMAFEHSQSAEAAAGAATATGYNTPDSLDFWQSRRRAIAGAPRSAGTHIVTGYTDLSTDSQKKLDSPAHPHAPFNRILSIAHSSSPLLKAVLEKRQAQHDKEASSQQEQSEVIITSRPNSAPPRL